MRGSAASEPSSGENIQHFSTIRVRAVGNGELKMSVQPIDYNIGRVKQLIPFILKDKNRIQPNRIVNYVDQRVAFEFQTTKFNEYVKINRIIVYMKEIYSSHPGA